MTSSRRGRGQRHRGPRRESRRQVRGGGTSGAHRQRRGSHTPLLVAAVAVVLGAVVAVVAALGGGVAGNTTRIVTAFPALKPAPAGTFSTASGTTTTLAAYRGHPVLAWFVATWCSSCQVGTQVLAAQGLPVLQAAGVRIVELELYRDLGQAGPEIVTFGRQYAGAQFANPDWTWGHASGPLTVAADPKGYLDIYYLIGPRGHVRYVNGAPASTLADLLRAVSALPGSSR